MQQRTVAMVYQQFINYPAMTVYENIASPLRVAGAGRARRSTSEVAGGRELLKLEPYLDRTPLSLSGGQQQRTAIARALVKNAASCCSTSRSPTSTTSCARNCARNCRGSSPASGTIFVYATTEPYEALLLGGNTATLSEGRVTQFGPTPRGLPPAGRPRHGADLLRSAAQHRRLEKKGGGRARWAA